MFVCNGKNVLIVGDITSSKAPHCWSSLELASSNPLVYTGAGETTGVWVVRQGDSLTPHGHTYDDCIPEPIEQTEASSIIKVNGIWVALEGDVVNCSATTISKMT